MGFAFPSLHGYRRAWLRGDLIAGLTVWAVLVPEALAYASIAGVSPVIGLYAAPPALLLYALFGSSRHLVVGPMSATAALSAATVGALVAGSGSHFVAMTAALAIVTGAAALFAGLARLGFLASFISEPVIKGFIVGLALTIIVGQVPKLLGVEKHSGDFFEQAWGVIKHLGDADGLTVAVGLASLVVVLGLKRLAPAVPASLVVVALGVAAVKLFNLDDHGLEIVGHIDSGLPSVGTPDVSWSDIGSLVAGGVGVMLVGFAEGLGAARTYAQREHYEIDTNRELLGLGAANLGAGLCSGMVVNGSLSKTAVNGSAGAKSQVSGLIVAVLTVVTLLLLTGLFEQLPEATLAAVVIAAVIELVDFPAVAGMYRVFSGRSAGRFAFAARPDFVAANAALLGVLIFDTLPGLFIGIAVSLTLLLYRASAPHVAQLGRVPGTTDQYGDLRRHPENRSPDGVVILRIEAGLFFANADAVRKRIMSAAAMPGVHAIVLDGEAMPFVDLTAARRLEEVGEDLQRRGVQLLLAGDVGQVRDVLARAGDTTHVHATVQEAVSAAAPTSERTAPA
ncbi:SulP family inorganic anion transporter [Conexibacter woesei]|uniref:SulP family inorganic anion transporter n=1 Tax=Conexibacter woesei TaxID=191495 RepID=UPI0004201725|nr:SulP family inorganic anion transporter [Conexibacter woesei]